MPESVTDRCVKSHEYIFLLTKSEKYYFDYKAIQEPAKTFENKPVEEITSIRFGGNKYGDNDDNHFQTYSGKEWKPQMKKLHRDGQTVQGMHKNRAEGGKDEMYAVRNKRDVWSVNTCPSSVEHIAMYPEKLIMPCILAGCPEGGIVYDCFLGSGTTALAVIHSLGNRKFIGSELSKEYAEIARKRIEPELNQTKLF
jgi:site-specific DNA-methyltransferase (adenine-specific)